MKQSPPASPVARTEPAASGLLTMPQAARHLAISKRTLERLVAAGEFPAPIKVGHSARVHPADLAAYVERLMLARGARPVN